MNKTDARGAIGRQGGFTLTEMVVVIAIIGTLAGLVAGAVGGLGASAQLARLGGDRDTIGKSADRFFTDAFPQTYPVVSLADTDPSLVPAMDLNVRLIDFEASLPQDPNRHFGTDYIKEIPNSAALVSWRINTETGDVHFARDGAVLARPSTARFDVSAADKTPGEVSTYTFKLRMNRGEAATEVISVTIPAGYAIGGQSLPAGQTIGSLAITFGADNPWDTGETITVLADLKTTATANEWRLVVDYDTNSSTGPVDDVNIKDTAGADVRTHKFSVIPPSTGSGVPGKLTITMDRTNESGGVVVYRDPDDNETTEWWALTLFGSVLTTNLVANPDTPAVYRWLAKEQTATDIKDYFDEMPGSQAIVIK